MVKSLTWQEISKQKKKEEEEERKLWARG